MMNDEATRWGRVCRGRPEGTVKEVRYKDGQLRVEVETEYNDEPATVTSAGKLDGNAPKG